VAPYTDLAALEQDYRIGLLRYLPRHEEAALTAGYALGRRAIVGGVNLLDLVFVHHRVLGDIVSSTAVVEQTAVIEAAGTFFAEVVAAYEMAQRGHLDRG
jgi:Phosphoserine phosphatase RsbU, N-terminal domain